MKSWVRTHFENLERLLKAQSLICQPGFPTYDIGLNREFFVREVLRTHLPTACEITSGSIYDGTQPKPTGQLDIILFHPLSLRVNLGVSDCCTSESVFTAIEIKSRLNESHFRDSVLNLAEVSTLTRQHLYTELKGATTESEAYHVQSIGTVLFGYEGYKAK